MPSVVVLDDVFVVVPPAVLARALVDPADWRRWWPGLHLRLHTDRGEQGLRWAVDGELVGDFEVWLEPVRDGTVAHLVVRAEPAQDGRPLPPSGRAARTGRRRGARVRLAWKAALRDLKRELEAGRPVGVPREARTQEAPREGG